MKRSASLASTAALLLIDSFGPLMLPPKQQGSQGRGSLPPGKEGSASATTIRPGEGSAAEEGGSLYHEETRCGCCGVYSPFLQRFRNVQWVLFFMCCIAFLRSFSMNGIMMVVLASLERRYQLTGSESGTVVSMNDVASCLMMLPVSFMASNRNKPRFVASGISMVGFGNFVITLAHFLAPPYRSTAGEGDENCPRLNPAGGLSCTGDSVRHFRFVLMFGQFMAGIGSTPINTVAIAYLDENVPPHKSPAYVGIFNSMAVFGPSMGFMFGGVTLKYYVDILTDVHSAGISPKSGAWVGAWWIGFLLSSCLDITLGVFTAMFPKHLPEYQELAEERKQGTEQNPYTLSGMQSHEFGLRLGDLPRAVARICKNPTFDLVCLATSFSQLYVTGITSVVTKFLQAQFAMTSSHAAFLIGPVALVGGAGGAIVGGILVTKMKLESAGILRLCMFNCLISFAGAFTFWVSCPDVDLAINTGYIAGSDSSTSQYDLPCNSHCRCTEDVVQPVCSADNKLFLSPCYAGCQTSLRSGSAVGYGVCSCVNGSMPVHGLQGGTPVQAVRARCKSDCHLLIVFLLGIFVCLTSIFLNVAPATALLIRVVKPRERSLALGVCALIQRLLGSIPAPVMFGAIVDSSCAAWKKRCGEQGNCITFHNSRLALGIFFILVTCIGGSITSYAVALCVVGRRKRTYGRKGKALPGL